MLDVPAIPEDTMHEIALGLVQVMDVVKECVDHTKKLLEQYDGDPIHTAAHLTEVMSYDSPAVTRVIAVQALIMLAQRT